jgi:hypothetical protein
MHEDGVYIYRNSTQPKTKHQTCLLGAAPENSGGIQLAQLQTSRHWIDTLQRGNGGLRWHYFNLGKCTCLWHISDANSRDFISSQPTTHVSVASLRCLHQNYFLNIHRKPYPKHCSIALVIFCVAQTGELLCHKNSVNSCNPTPLSFALGFNHPRASSEEPSASFYKRTSHALTRLT